MMWLKEIATTVYQLKQDATSGIIGVQRNTIYKIYATITGEGSKDPDTSELNACISFSIKVEPLESHHAKLRQNVKLIKLFITINSENGGSEFPDSVFCPNDGWICALHRYPYRLR